jgi:hypothetical protein
MATTLAFLLLTSPIWITGLIIWACVSTIKTQSQTRRELLRSTANSGRWGADPWNQARFRWYDNQYGWTAFTR